LNIVNAVMLELPTDVVTHNLNVPFPSEAIITPIASAPSSSMRRFTPGQPSPR
jgi:hypothetical protein